MVYFCKVFLVIPSNSQVSLMLYLLVAITFGSLLVTAIIYSSTFKSFIQDRQQINPIIAGMNSQVWQNTITAIREIPKPMQIFLLLSVWLFQLTSRFHKSINSMKVFFFSLTFGDFLLLVHSITMIFLI